MSIVIYDTVPSPPDEPAREAAVVASGALALTGAPALQERTREAARAFGTRFAAVTILLRDWQYIIAAHGIAMGVTRRSTSFCSHAVRQPQRTLVVLDARADPSFAGNPYVVDEPAIRFYAGAPLLDAAGMALGSLCVFDTKPSEGFGPNDQAALMRRAAEIAALIAKGGEAVARTSVPADRSIIR